MRRFLLTDEASHQEALFQWVAYQTKVHKELELLYHVPNGGKRDAVTARNLARQGVKPGVSDLVLPVARSGYHGLYIELKIEGGSLQDSQIRFLNSVSEEGYLALVCVGWNAAAEALIAYITEQDINAKDLKTKSTPSWGTYVLKEKEQKGSGNE